MRGFRWREYAVRTLQGWPARVPGKHRATRAVRDEVGKLSELERALVEDRDVMVSPEQLALGGILLARSW